MRLAGSVALGGGAREGVLVPEAAVVWHGGGAWAYVKEDNDTFVRRPVDTSHEASGGWFNAEGFEQARRWSCAARSCCCPRS